MREFVAIAKHCGYVSVSDKSDIRFGVRYGAKDKVVISFFGTPVTWLGMSSEQAMELAKALMEHAEVSEKEKFEKLDKLIEKYGIEDISLCLLNLTHPQHGQAAIDRAREMAIDIQEALEAYVKERERP